MNAQLQALVNFVEKYKHKPLTSTSCEVVNFSDDLYNVEGSTDDPKIDGNSWTALLNSEIPGLSDCYVTASDPWPPVSSSHPGFNVGGHMIDNAQGHVDEGGTCYLMPLCSWHNSTARDGVAFEHDETEMLELSGYMEGDLAETFQLRFPSEHPFAVLYFSLGEIKHTNINRDQVQIFKQELLSVESDETSGRYVLFERVQEDSEMKYYIREYHLS